MRKARCKFTVIEVLPAYPNAPEHDVTVRMTAQYDPHLTQEDEAFSKATPWGTLTFGVHNPSLAGFFKEGTAFYVDLTPVE